MKLAHRASLKVKSDEHPNRVRDIRVADLSYDDENKMFSYVQNGSMYTILREHVIGWRVITNRDDY